MDGAKSQNVLPINEELQAINSCWGKGNQFFFFKDMLLVLSGQPWTDAYMSTLLTEIGGLFTYGYGLNILLNAIGYELP